MAEELDQKALADKVAANLRQPDTEAVCPRCGYHSVDSSNLEFGSGGVTCDVDCPRCGLHWVEVYHFHEAILFEDRGAT